MVSWFGLNCFECIYFSSVCLCLIMVFVVVGSLVVSLCGSFSTLCWLVCSRLFGVIDSLFILIGFFMFLMRMYACDIDGLCVKKWKFMLCVLLRLCIDLLVM